jgi:hypothetical protein
MVSSRKLRDNGDMGLLDEAKAAAIEKATNELESRNRQESVRDEVRALVAEFVNSARSAGIDAQELRQFGSVTFRAYGPRLVGWKLDVTRRSPHNGKKVRDPVIITVDSDLLWFSPFAVAVPDAFPNRKDGEAGVSVFDSMFFFSTVSFRDGLRSSMVERLTAT